MVTPPTEPFDISKALQLVADAVQPYPRAAMFELAEQGFATPFQQLVACIISIRTRDEESLPASLRLFAVAATAAQVAALTPEQIADLIRPATSYERKARQILAIAQITVDKFKGDLPCEEDILLQFAGVGPKCAHLTLGVACRQPSISVDVHVHRIVNRWGYVLTRTPEQTMLALEETLPPEYWIEINALLVPFGKHICTGTAPRCSTCPVRHMCPKIGVTTHR
jgi:endonuclease III